MNTYHLVTTPIYETWSNNSINLLAGQWCRIYRDNKIAAKYKHQVADYHWDDRKKFFKDSLPKKLIDLNVKYQKSNAVAAVRAFCN